MKPTTRPRSSVLAAFGSLLKSVREEAGLTQSELSRRTGMSKYRHTTISNWERGIHAIDIEDLYRVASALGVDPWDMLPPCPAGPEPDAAASPSAPTSTPGPTPRDAGRGG